jgi:hypothetical protein
MSGKRYPEEFKIEAVKQVTNRGYKVGEVARRLGVTPKSMLECSDCDDTNPDSPIGCLFRDGFEDNVESK